MREAVPAKFNQVENLSEWRSRRDSAPKQARELLEGAGLAVELDEISTEELEREIEALSAIIDKLSYVDGDKLQVRNENRFVVRELENLLVYAKELQPRRHTVNPLSKQPVNG